jgi:Biotin and Thiamin Synthesis associated domain
MPSTIIRFAAGRQTYSEAEQAMCFLAGANAIFTGEAMLTTPCALSFYILISRFFAHVQTLTESCTGLNLRYISTHSQFAGSPWDEVSLVFLLLHSAPPLNTTFPHPLLRIKQ